MELGERVSLYLANNSGQYLALALALGGIATILSLGAFLKLRSLVRPFARVKDEHNPSDVLPAVLNTVEKTERKMEGVATTLERHLEDSRAFLKHVGLVRYDAFEDIGGQQSYSMCLLDAEKTGVLITYLTGKNSTRSYAVTVRNGVPSRKLGDEETRAMEAALSYTPVTEVG